MNMKQKALAQIAQTKIDSALDQIHDPAVELSILSTKLVTTCLKYSERDWDKAMQLLELAARTCRKSIENGKKIFGDKAFKKK